MLCAGFVILFRNLEHTQFLHKTTKPHLSVWLLSLIVEPEGFEPSSKQAITMPSTCLVFTWFSMHDRLKTAYRTLSFLRFWWRYRSHNTLMLTFLVLLNEPPSTRAVQEHLASLPSRDEAYPTIIQIMRQERNYYRQLKV